MENLFLLPILIFIIAVVVRISLWLLKENIRASIYAKHIKKQMTEYEEEEEEEETE